MGSLTLPASGKVFAEARAFIFTEERHTAYDLRGFVGCPIPVQTPADVVASLSGPTIP